MEQNLTVDDADSADENDPSPPMFRSTANARQCYSAALEAERPAQDFKSDFIRTLRRIDPGILRSLVESEAPILREEADHARASQTPAGHWALFLGVAGFVETCEQGRKAVQKAKSPGDLAQVHCEFAGTIDRAHAQLKATAEEHDVPEVVALVDRGYGDDANDLNQRFFGSFTADESLDIPGVPFVMGRLDAFIGTDPFIVNYWN
jgi:hypothetical protein